MVLGAADAGSQARDSQADVKAETRSTKARLKEISGYIDELGASLAPLALQAEDAALREEEAAAALDAATSPSVSPFLAARDDLHRRREQVLRRNSNSAETPPTTATVSVPRSAADTANYCGPGATPRRYPLPSRPTSPPSYGVSRIRKLRPAPAPC